ncbi:MAG: HEPN domain-containing protein [Parachlamydiaceae bacterium]
MTFHDLAREYFKKAKIRLKALYVLNTEGGYSDVVRESQELVELLLKGQLRLIGIDPPKWHDVGSILLQNKSKLGEDVQLNLQRIMDLSSYLRKEREMSFYGDEDFLPSDHYSKEDAAYCIAEVEWVLQLLTKYFEPS